MSLKEDKYVLTHKNVISLIIFIVLFCTYIFPTAEFNVSNQYAIPKAIFCFMIVALYILTMKIEKSNIKSIVFIIAILFFTIITKEINYLTFITITFLYKVLEYKKEIYYYLKKSNILYVCLFFTIIYSIKYFGINKRYAFTAIQEINQSGFAIFCLGIMLMIKNKKIGWLTLLFGILTLSRSYVMAILCYILFNFKAIKKIFNEKFQKKLNYFNITIFSSLILIFLGIFYIFQFKSGNISKVTNEASRLFNFLDYSNYYRFTAIILLLSYFKNNVKSLFLGISDSEFFKYGIKESSALGIQYRYTVPHNLFFSHLKIYGLFAILEIIYISKILKKITNNDNLGIYFAIVLYSIFLGVGLYSYWLYLSAFALISYSLNEEKNEIV